MKTATSELDTLKLRALGQVIAACLWLILAVLLFVATIINAIWLWFLASGERTATLALFSSQAALSWICKRKSDELLAKNRETLNLLDAAKRKAGAL